MMVLAGMAGMAVPLSTLLSVRQQAGQAAHVVVVSELQEQPEGSPCVRVLSKSAPFTLAAVPPAKASHMLKPRFCAAGDHPQVWSRET